MHFLLFIASTPQHFPSFRLLKPFVHITRIVRTPRSADLVQFIFRLPSVGAFGSLEAPRARARFQTPWGTLHPTATDYLSCSRCFQMRLWANLFYCFVCFAGIGWVRPRRSSWAGTRRARLWRRWERRPSRAIWYRVQESASFRRLPASGLRILSGC